MVTLEGLTDLQEGVNVFPQEKREEFYPPPKYCSSVISRGKIIQIQKSMSSLR